VVASGSLVWRFRRAHGIERQQLRWLALAALSALVLLVAMVAPGAVSQAAFGVRVALLPLATGAPILRYGLYDLDRIISRTLAYGLLTLVPAAGYAALVLGLGQLLGQDSSLVVAAATLGVAATFQSARRRIQQGVDWRFNRRRYDAARTPGDLRSPAARPGRPGYVAAELLAVVDQTMQPTQGSLWLPPQVRSNKAQGQAADLTTP
jgi:hypothetical protein